MWEASAAENPARGMSGAGRVAQERAGSLCPHPGCPRGAGDAPAPAVAEDGLAPQRVRVAAAGAAAPARSPSEGMLSRNTRSPPRMR